MMTTASKVKTGDVVMIRGKDHTVLSRYQWGRNVVLQLSNMSEGYSLEPDIEIEVMEPPAPPAKWTVDGTTIYELDTDGCNRWFAGVQTAGRVSTAERESIADKMGAADEMYVALKAFMMALGTDRALTSSFVLRALEDAQAKGALALARAEGKAV